MITQGIHHGLGMEEYHSWKLDKSNLIEGPISCSMLKAFDSNPYAWLKSPEKEQTKAMREGALFDAAVTDYFSIDSLLPAPQLREDYVVAPFDNFMSKAAKEWKKSAEENNENYLTAKQEEKYLAAFEEESKKYDSKISHLRRAREEVINHPIAGKLMDGAQFQVGVVGEIGAIPTKCLIDILPSEDGEFPEVLVDYKTISTGLDDESIRKAIGKFKYHWQAAFYRTLFNKVSVDRLCEEFKFIFQDVNTLEVRVVTLDEDSLALGTRAVSSSIQRFTRCAHNGIKSQYLKTDHELSLMPYHAMNEDEELTNRETKK